MSCKTWSFVRGSQIWTYLSGDPDANIVPDGLQVNAYTDPGVSSTVTADASIVRMSRKLYA